MLANMLSQFILGCKSQVSSRLLWQTHMKAKKHWLCAAAVEANLVPTVVLIVLWHCAGLQFVYPVAIDMVTVLVQAVLQRV